MTDSHFAFSYKNTEQCRVLIPACLCTHNFIKMRPPILRPFVWRRCAHFGAAHERIQRKLGEVSQVHNTDELNVRVSVMR